MNFNGKYAANPKIRGEHKTDKQRGHGRRHDGFNDRWDAMEKADQCSGKRNKRSVWTVATQPYSGAHFAVFPAALIEPCILAGCPKGGTVLDCFGGAGTTGLVADRLGRNAILIELNPQYAHMARKRIADDAGMFSTVAEAVP
jgi:DNA modification methylase